MSWSICQKFGKLIRNVRGVINERRAREANIPTATLVGDRDVEWAWVVGNICPGGGECLDFGPGPISNTSLAAAMCGYKVTTLDLRVSERPYVMPSVHNVTEDVLSVNFSPARFDLILNCSTIEHVGLKGCYGNRSDEDGDLKAMARLREWAKPEATHLLTIPVGQDRVFDGLHRIYGEHRLPLLLRSWRLESQQYWRKQSNNKWCVVPRDDALKCGSRSDLYGLGLFVLSAV